jgi:hypothetical protein
MSTTPTGGRIPEMADILGCFLEGQLPIRAFATLTTRTPASQGEFDDFIHQWVRDLQEHNGITLGWLGAYEYTPRRHAHVALIASAPLDCVHAESQWRIIAAPLYRQAAVVRKHRDGICGLGYILKSLDTPAEEIEFSDNLSSFVRGSVKSLFRSNSAQRRQRRRIHAQMKTYSHCAVPPHAKPCTPVIPSELLAMRPDK